jgi:hypothetical protein
MDTMVTDIASVDEVAVAFPQHPPPAGHGIPHPTGETGGPQHQPAGHPGAEPSSRSNAGYQNPSDGNHRDMVLLILGAIVFLAVIFVIWRRISSGPKSPNRATYVPPEERPAPPISDMGHDPAGWVPGRTGNRPRQKITEVEPSAVIGRIREIRLWEEKGIFFKWKMKAFHLDSDHSQPDFGDLMVTLRLNDFRRLRLEDGDLLEIGLKWKRRREFGCIPQIRNITSGQLLKPASVSEKAGKLEEVVVAR